MSDVSQGPGWWQASDGKWYPPQPAPPTTAPPPLPPPPAGPAPQWSPPPAKKGGNKGCLIALAVAGVLLVLGIAATIGIVIAVRDEVDERVDTEGGITTFSDNDENPPADDVSVDECGPAEGTNFMRATVDVQNHSSEASNYIITVAFETDDGGRQLTTSTAFVNGLGPDQTATAESNSFQEPPSGEDFTCRISQVERFAA